MSQVLSIVDCWLQPLLPRPNDRKPANALVSGWPSWWAIVGWGSAVLASSFAAALAVGAGAEDEGVARLFVGQIGLWAVFLVTATIASRRFGTGRLSRDFRLGIAFGDAARAVGVGVVVQLAVVPLVYVPLVAAGVDLDVSEPARELFRGLSPFGAILVGSGAVIFAPVAEELLFRGVLLRGLADRFGAGPAIWLSAGFFAGTHFQLVQFPGLLAVGLVLAWLATRTGSVGAPLWAHVGFNATTVVMLAMR